MFKKVILSLVVIVTFGFYVYNLKLGKIEETNIILPKVKSSPKTKVSTLSFPENKYQDGKYTGEVFDAYYGNVQVGVVISKGKISRVNFLEYPDDRVTSERINSIAMPLLIEEAISAQSAEVDIVSGATQTSKAFRKSLESALAKAKES